MYDWLLNAPLWNVCSLALQLQLTLYLKPVFAKISSYTSKLLLHEAPWSKNHLQVQVYVPRRLKLKSRTLCTFSQLTDLSMKGCGWMTNQLLWSYENLNLQKVWGVLRYFVISKGDISTKDLPRKFISGLAFVWLVCLYYRSSHQRRCSLTKAVLRHFAKLAGNHLC